MSGWSGAGGSFGGGGGGSFGDADGHGSGPASGFGPGGGSFGGGGGQGVGSGGGGTFMVASGGPGGAGAGLKQRAWDPSVTGIACARLREAQWRVQGALHALRSAPDLVVAPAPGVRAGALRLCAAEIDARAAATVRLVEQLDLLHDQTLLAGRAYAWASDAVRDLIEGVAGNLAYSLGSAVRGALFAAGPMAVAIGLVAVPLAARMLLMNPQLLASVAQRAQTAGQHLGRFLEDTSAFWERAGEALMADPVFAAALRLAIESSDEALAGFLGIPAPVAAAIEDGIGDNEVMGVLATAAAAGMGLMSGGGRVQAVFSRPVAVPDAPVSDPAEAMRIIIEQDEQVTIYAFAMPDGSTRYQVFVRGTQLDAPSGLDMRANVENAGSLDNAPGLDGLHGSDAAVAEAMREAGIGAGDPVDMFGFSQGAGAVANVVASGEFSVETALLVGGPVAAAELPRDVAVFSVAHHGDVVPPLDGRADGEGVHTTMVESAGGHGTGFLARHSGLEYVETLESEALREDFVFAAYQERLAAASAGGEGVSGVSVHLRRR